MALVLSTKAHAYIKNVDPAEALSMPGVRDFISHIDVPGYNTWGAIFSEDEEIFASSQVKPSVLNEMS